jgi:hypothetical protein
VLGRGDYSSFSILQSCIHEAWARKQASSLETRLRYTPSDVFETFPFPTFDNELNLESIGREFDDLRNSYSVKEMLGITKIYNRFHDKENQDSNIQALRDKQRSIDIEVARAYGWSDISLDHNFIKVPYLPDSDNLRYTISEEARLQILDRLSELNRIRYAEEQSENFVVDSSLGAKIKKSKSSVKKKNQASTSQSSLDF